MEKRDNKLTDSLIKDGWLKTKRIIDAFKEINREDFLPEDIKSLSQINEALPIGFRQTISQPLTVAFMLELLQPNPGDRILDVGSGSGWTSALLANIVGSSGKVISIELVPELKQLGEKNVAKYNFIKEGIVEYILGDGSKGFKEQAPYDRILVSAAAESKKEVRFLKEQLKTGGQLVCPIQNSIWLFIKNPPSGGKNDEFQEKEYPGFVFVPLVEG